MKTKVDRGSVDLSACSDLIVMRAALGAQAGGRTWGATKPISTDCWRSFLLRFSPKERPACRIALQSSCRTRAEHAPVSASDSDGRH